jgi:type IV pilus assembly protein PilC
VLLDKPRLAHEGAAEARAVGAAEVAQHDALRGGLQLQVVAADGWVAQPQRDALGGADGERAVARRDAAPRVGAGHHLHAKTSHREEVALELHRAVEGRQFATMIDAGLPLVQCLDILATQEPNRFFKKVLTDVKHSVESGATFATRSRSTRPSSIPSSSTSSRRRDRRHPRHHPQPPRHLHREERQARPPGQGRDDLPDRHPRGRQRRGLRAAQVGHPDLRKMFSDMGDAQLPALTQVVINASHWFGNWWWAVIIAVGAFLYSFKRVLATEKGRTIFDTVMLKMPVFGPLLRKVAVAKFTRTLGTMIASGVPILDALEIVAKAANNKVIEKAIYFVRDKISEGSNMAEPLAKTRFFRRWSCR